MEILCVYTHPDPTDRSRHYHTFESRSPLSEMMRSLFFFFFQTPHRSLCIISCREIHVWEFRLMCAWVGVPPPFSVRWNPDFFESSMQTVTPLFVFPHDCLRPSLPTLILPLYLYLLACGEPLTPFPPRLGSSSPLPKNCCKNPPDSPIKNPRSTSVHTCLYALCLTTSSLLFAARIVLRNQKESTRFFLGFDYTNIPPTCRAHSKPFNPRQFPSGRVFRLLLRDRTVS